MALQVKKGLTRKDKDFTSIYSELRQMLKAAWEEEQKKKPEEREEPYIEVRAVKDHYRISPNKISAFKQGLKAWHLAVVTGPHEGKGKGPDVIVYSPPSPEQKEKKVKQAETKKKNKK